MHNAAPGVVDALADALVAELAWIARGGPLDVAALELAVGRFVAEVDWSTTGLTPADPGQEKLYRLGEAVGEGPAVYLVSDGVGVVSPPHEHETWAVVAGVTGREINHLFARSSLEPGVVLRSETKVVGPGDVLGLASDAVHSTAVAGGEPTFHVHVYGRPLDTLSGFETRRFQEAV